MNKQERRAAVASVTCGPCWKCGRTMVARAVGCDGNDLTVVCEKCWPALPETWREERYLTGYVRNYARAKATGETWGIAS